MEHRVDGLTRSQINDRLGLAMKDWLIGYGKSDNVAMDAALGDVEWGIELLDAIDVGDDCDDDECDGEVNNH